MAKQSGTFVPDERLMPPDRVGGSMGLNRSVKFGEGGKTTGGEPANGHRSPDEMKAPKRRGGY